MMDSHTGGVVLSISGACRIGRARIVGPAEHAGAKGTQNSFIFRQSIPPWRFRPLSHLELDAWRPSTPIAALLPVPFPGIQKNLALIPKGLLDKHTR
jgi:hypothetical protein